MESTWLAIHPLSPSDDPGAVRVLAPGLVQSRIVDTHTKNRNTVRDTKKNGGNIPGPMVVSKV